MSIDKFGRDLLYHRLQKQKSELVGEAKQPTVLQYLVIHSKTIVKDKFMIYDGFPSFIFPFKFATIVNVIAPLPGYNCKVNSEKLTDVIQLRGKNLTNHDTIHFYRRYPNQKSMSVILLIKVPIDGY